MAWIEVHQSLKDHWKTLEAADLLEINPAHMMGHLISLWLWVLDNTPDGNIFGKTPRTIARAAQWEGDPKTFLDVLVRAHLLDEDHEILVIHDWYDYAGKLIEQRLAERVRSRERRKKLKKPLDDQAMTEGQPLDDQQRTVGTVHYPTEQYNTKEHPPISPQGGAVVTDAQGENLKVKTARGVGSEKPTDQSMTLVAQRFGEFWEAYPKKMGKGAAEKSWSIIKPTDELFRVIMTTLETAKQCEQWGRENGRYIPNPATWLNQKRWDDEYVAPSQLRKLPLSERKRNGFCNFSDTHDYNFELLNELEMIKMPYELALDSATTESEKDAITRKYNADCDAVRLRYEDSNRRMSM